MMSRGTKTNSFMSELTSKDGQLVNPGTFKNPTKPNSQPQMGGLGGNQFPKPPGGLNPSGGWIAPPGKQMPSPNAFPKPQSNAWGNSPGPTAPQPQPQAQIQSQAPVVINDDYLLDFGLPTQTPPPQPAPNAPKKPVNKIDDDFLSF